MRKNKPQIIDNLEVTTGGAFKRTGAVLLDALLVVILMVVLNFAVHPIVNSFTKIDATVEAHTRDIKRSGLVGLDTAILEDESNIDLVQIKNDPQIVTKRAESTYYFYTVFLAKENTDTTLTYDNEWYLVNILKIDETETLFVRVTPEPSPKTHTIFYSEVEVTHDPFVPSGAAYKDGVTSDQINTFNNKIYSAAAKLFNSRPAVAEITKVRNLEMMGLIVLASSVFFLALPIFLKDGQTLGKKIFNLGVATKHGYKVGPLSLLVRYFAFILLYVLSSLIIPLVVLFISFTFMIFNKKGRALHDFIAMTRVVDLSKSKIYADEEEYTLSLKSVQVRDSDSYNEEVFHERFDEESGA